MLHHWRFCPLGEKMLKRYTGGHRSGSATTAHNFACIQIEMSFGLVINKWFILQDQRLTSIQLSHNVHIFSGRLHDSKLPPTQVLCVYTISTQTLLLLWGCKYSTEESSRSTFSSPLYTARPACFMLLVSRAVGLDMIRRE